MLSRAVDEIGIRDRFRMTIVTAFAMCISSTLMHTMIRYGFGVGTDAIQ
jgi:hypothetical protein